MINRIVLKLTSARFLIALMLTITLCYLAIIGKAETDVFIPICTLAIGFYFNKNGDESNANNKTDK